MQELQGVFNFIEDEVQTDDLGAEHIDGYTVMFEGFTDECWDFAGDKGLDEIEQELLEDWKEQLGDAELIHSDWRGDVFFAVFY